MVPSISPAPYTVSLEETETSLVTGIGKFKSNEFLWLLLSYSMALFFQLYFVLFLARDYLVFSKYYQWGTWESSIFFQTLGEVGYSWPLGRRYPFKDLSNILNHSLAWDLDSSEPTLRRLPWGKKSLSSSFWIQATLRMASAMGYILILSITFPPYVHPVTLATNSAHLLPNTSASLFSYPQTLLLSSSHFHN